MSAKLKIAIIRRDERDWTPIVAVVSCPKTPALSTMVKRFHEQFGFYIWDGGIPDGAKIVERIHQDHNAVQKAQDSGYIGHHEADVFVDWLIKQDAGFELVKFQEVSL
jgi:hypothetical protein